MGFLAAIFKIAISINVSRDARCYEFSTISDHIAIDEKTDGNLSDFYNSDDTYYLFEKYIIHPFFYQHT